MSVILKRYPLSYVLSTCKVHILTKRFLKLSRLALKTQSSSRNISWPCESPTMKLVTNEHNYFLLKIYAAANVSQKTLETQVVDNFEPEGVESSQKHRLPYIECDDGKIISGPNSICRYLIHAQKSALFTEAERLKIDHAVEWDNKTVQVCTSSYLSAVSKGDKVQTNVIDAVEKCLGELNELLKPSGCIAGDTITVADIVLWGSLFIVFQDGHLLERAKSKFPAAYEWFCSLDAKTEFKAARDQVIGSHGITIFKRGPSAEEIQKAKASWKSEKSHLKTKIERKHPLLPKEGEKNILITSALPYVNNVPHLGNIIGCVLSGDVYSRYCRLRGYNCLYICGTDEYGTATETKAMEEGLTPQQICDKYSKVHEEVYQWFNIDFDYFGRTTTKQQTEIAQDIFWKLEENGYLLKDTISQLLCEKCDRFLADRFVEGICPNCSYQDARGDQCDACGKLINAIDLKSPRCKVCRAQPVVKTSNHVFLDLPKIEPELKEWVEKSFTDGQWTNNSVSITKGWLQEGLNPRCITRDLKWGTPVPLEGYTDKVFYVWFDAPIGYLSITANYTDEWEKWWKNPDQVTLVQFMAKDNVPFHTVVFPCSLIGAKDNYTLLNDISATEYLNYEDDKFSKSRGIGVFGDNAAETGIPADVFRFYLLAVRPESQDSVFSWSDFVARNNSELLSNLGNFINRALTFLSNHFQGIIPETTLIDADYDAIALINREISSYIGNLEKIKVRAGLRNVLNISKLGNQYLQSNEPWSLLKGSQADKARAGSVIAVACNICATLGQLLSPYMPEVSQEIRTQLQFPSELDVIQDALFQLLPEKHQIGSPKPLFKKIEVSTGEELRKRFGGGQVKECKANKDPSSVGAKKLQEAISIQESAIQKMKAAKAGQEIIDGEVAKLEELKKKLTL